MLNYLGLQIKADSHDKIHSVHRLKDWNMKYKDGTLFSSTRLRVLHSAVKVRCLNMEYKGQASFKWTLEMQISALLCVISDLSGCYLK